MKRHPLAVMPLLASLLLVSCGRKAERSSGPSTDPTVPPRPPTFATVRPEQDARKARSDARLQAEGIPILPSLPVIAGEAEAKMRTADAVVDRAIALMIVAVKGEGLDPPTVDRIRTTFTADGYFSPQEKAFLANPSPNERDRAKFTWRYECLAVLEWALGYVDKLDPPSHIVDAGKAVRIFKDAGPQRFRSAARLRSAAEILDEANLIYRYDWACVNARVAGTSPPRGIDCEIVMERHHALNWLCGYQGQAWDDVSTDT